MIFLYALTLASSAGLTGLFVRQALGEQGYVPGFGAGVLLACGIAAAFAGLQMLYLATVRFVWPTRTNWPLLSECISHGAALVFVPFLLHISIHWPHPAMHQFEGAVYFAIFLGVHAVLKLLAFYAILRSEPGPRAWNLVWAAAAIVLIAGGAGMFSSWLSNIEKARPRAPEALSYYRVGTAAASAREMPEGSVLSVDATASLGQCLTFAVALPPDAEQEEPLESAYLIVEMHGETTTRFSGPVRIEPNTWSHLQIPADQLPKNLKSCRVRWSAAKESKWRRAVGILPVIASSQNLLVAGPKVTEARADDTGPNIVVIVVDGLGSDRVTSMGYPRATTPNLDRLVQAADTFPHAYTSTPEAAGACMTLLTGLSPLRHGFLGTQRGPLPGDSKPLPESLRAARYATAAFTEGEMWGDLTQGSGFERGFDLFDDGYNAEPDLTKVTESAAASAGASPAAPAAGSIETLHKAQNWIDAHKDVKFMTFVRLSELRDARTRERYGRGFTPDPASATPSNIYDSVILYLDRGIGEFVNHLKELPGGKKTCIVITSTRGSYLPENTPTADWTLRVPVILLAPGVAPAKHKELIGLEDVAPTLAKLARESLSPYASTADLIGAPISREPISMTGNPLLLTIRNTKMRLDWSTQRAPFTLQVAGPSAAASLYDLTRIRAGVPPTDIASRNPELTRRWVEKLEQYFTMQSEGWQTKPGK